MTGKMNHLTACRAQAAICREKAATDVGRRDYWLGEARKWEARAEEAVDGVAISYEVKEGRLVPKPD